MAKSSGVTSSAAKLAEQKASISADYVAVIADVAQPEAALETLADAGQTFAVVPVSSLSKDQLAEAMPVWALQGSASFEVPTGAFVLRWEGRSSDVLTALQSAGFDLVRDYGAGGVVMAKTPESLFEAAARLCDMEFVRSVSLHTLRQAQRR